MANAPPVKRTCIRCGAEFFTYPVQVRMGKAKYCSKLCANRSRGSKFEKSVILSNYTTNENGCWIWNKGKTSPGYGAIQIQGTYWLAHRLSYTLFKGPIPSDLIVRHRCDNPSCVNPDHLDIGTHADNQNDAVERDRVEFGSSRYNAKLTESDIPEIRKLLRIGISLCEIGRQFGVDSRAISYIRDGKRWVRA